MDFLQRLLNEQGYRITQDLVGKLGFSSTQAGVYLPQAISSVVLAFQGGKLDITALMGGGDASPLLERIDVSALAQEVGIDEELASVGLAALVPTLLRALREGNGPDFGQAKSLASGL